LQLRLDQACSAATMSGSDWDELTWLLSTLPIMLPMWMWEDLAERLLTEMIISDGIRWHQRYEAFNRVLGHPVGQRAAIAACASLGADPANQVVIETVSALDFSRHADANTAVMNQLLNPTSDQSQQGALLACFRKVRFGHFTPTQRRRIFNLLVQLTVPRESNGRSRTLASQVMELFRLPQAPAGVVNDDSPLLAGHQFEREIVVGRLTGAATAQTPNIPESFDDDVLPRLIEEMLFAVSWDARLVASSFIAVSPYREGVSKALFDEFRAERTLFGDAERVHVLLSALRFVGGSNERRLLERMVLAGGVPAQTAVAAAYSIGHLDRDADPAALSAAIKKYALQWESSRSPDSAALLEGLVYSAAISGQISILAGVKSGESVPAPLRSAARWWLDLPSSALNSVQQ
jgi:hypothetical protein